MSMTTEREEDLREKQKLDFAILQRQNAVRALLEDMNANEIMDIPGVYPLLSHHLSADIDLYLDEVPF